MKELIGRKFEVVRFIDDWEDSCYGAKVGDVIVIGEPSSHFPSAVWAHRSENPGVFSEKDFADCKLLCIADNVDQLLKHFKEVV